MPTYEYACVACGHEFEAFQSFSDSALTECPECKGELRKVYSNVGVVFKGSGFYKTDSRSSSSATTPATPTTPAPAATPVTPAKGSDTKK
jgi:putative FmdB family regulatory protein